MKNLVLPLLILPVVFLRDFGVKCAAVHIRDIAISSFPTVHSNVAKTTIGLALPESSDDDLLVNLTTSLPYGYAGFAPANTFNANSSQDNSKLHVLAAWVGLNSNRRSGSYGPIAQYSTVGNNGTSMHFDPSGSVTISDLWFYDDDAEAMTVLLRCQNCSLIPSSTPDETQVPLQIFWTATAPVFNPGHLNAILPVQEVISENVVFNAAAARRSDYEQILATVGLI
ncbi:hypothetical protein VKT23_015151 [Stygiomarasmius scandens]|uniref:Cellobiose dehydrogenase cytochrome domain-containing protein n=1 Tax=Marasmiellus scandens TaxID=2682957 RepID=A0ABR1IYV6_9AGAR